MNSEKKKFYKLMEVGFSLRMSTEEVLEMLSKSSLSDEFKYFSKQAYDQYKFKAIKLSESMKESNLFLYEEAFIISKVEHYNSIEISKAFLKLFDYCDFVGKVNTEIHLTKRVI